MSKLNQEIIEGLAELLHKWYLEATSTLNKQSYNENAQKPFSELTEQQKFIDRYIAGKVLEKVKQGAKLREEEIIEMIVKKLDFLNNILNKEANETDKLVNQLGVNVAIKSLEDLMKLIKGEKWK